MLIRPCTASDEQAMRTADRLMKPWVFSLDLEDRERFARWLQRREREERGEVPDGRVPAVFRVAEIDGAVVGRVSVRLALNDWLARFGGHVGYGVLPDHRRRGVATALLHHALGLLAGAGVTQALMVCDEANIGSAAVAERCGGILTARTVAEDGRPIRHYLVPTPA